MTKILEDYYHDFIGNFKLVKYFGICVIFQTIVNQEINDLDCKLTFCRIVCYVRLGYFRSNQAKIGMFEGIVRAYAFFFAHTAYTVLQIYAIFASSVTFVLI